MLRAILAVLLFLVPMGAFAQDCEVIEASCSQAGTPSVGGVRLEGVCQRLDLVELCQRDQPVDECVPFDAAAVTHSNQLGDGQCRQTSKECSLYKAGRCERWRLTYTCWNGPLAHPPADLLDRVFRNFEDQIHDDCASLDSDSNCTLIDTITTEDYETRSVNGMEVTRAWWARDRQYDCTDPTLEETCGPFEQNPVCRKTDSELCLVRDSDGTCVQVEYGFECDLDPSFEASCEAINVCVGDNCTGIEQDPSEDFAKAAAWLNILNALAEDFGCSKEGEIVDPETGEIDLGACPIDPPFMAAFEPSLFAGEKMTCKRGVINCCDGDGEGSCSPMSEELALHRQAQVTHHLGNQCTSKVLGTCLEVREHHCVYRSKFARVFQEQAHLQTGSQFGDIWSTHPCHALDVYQLDVLDVDKMDFSEIFDEIIGGLSVPAQSNVMDQLTKGVTILAPEVGDVFDQ